MLHPLFEFSWVEILIRIFVAVLIGGAVGIEREYKNRPAGMRTHVLVCLGATMIALLECLTRTDMTTQTGNVTMTFGRLSAQVISGIGFLGAGTIFIAQKKIAGLTTAASLWNVACLGLLVGFGYYVVALIGCGIILIVLTLLQRIIHVNAIKRVEIKFTNRSETLPYINNYFDKQGIKVLDMDFHIESAADTGTADDNVYTNLYTLHLPAKMTYTDIVTYLAEYKSIQSVRTRNT
jgi:putative Mg2+ transporter-C (MgtC) family protein